MNLALQKGYRITKVYYTNSEGELEKFTLKKLSEESDKHISKYYRNKTINFKF